MDGLTPAGDGAVADHGWGPDLDAARSRFGAELKRLRVQDGYTQTSLATQMGYHKSYISEMESGHCRPIHDRAHLSYSDSMHRLTIYRQIENVGNRAINGYPFRVHVDRYPGNPERSRALYPLRPGERATFVNQYVVSEEKWGRWFQRHVRFRTDRYRFEWRFGSTSTDEE